MNRFSRSLKWSIVTRSIFTRDTQSICIKQINSQIINETMPMRNRYKSLFPLSSSIPNSLIHSTMHTRVGSLRIIYIFFIIFFLLTSYSLYTIYTTSHQRPPVMPFVDFQTSFGYKKNLMQHGVKELCDKIEWKQNAYLDCYSRMGTFNAINFVQV